jgi:uncharacterized membrane protein
MPIDPNVKVQAGHSTRIHNQYSTFSLFIDGWVRMRNWLLIRVFVDSVSIHRFWHCHRRPDRSFFVMGRQFHICARCTGILTGLIACPVFIPIRNQLPAVFLIAVAGLLIDSLTQLAGWRESNNRIRFSTGLAVGLTAGPTFLTLGGL